MLGGQPWRVGVVAPPSVAVLLTGVLTYLLTYKKSNKIQDNKNTSQQKVSDPN